MLIFFLFLAWICLCLSSTVDRRMGLEVVSLEIDQQQCRVPLLLSVRKMNRDKQRGGWGSADSNTVMPE